MLMLLGNIHNATAYGFGYGHSRLLAMLAGFIFLFPFVWGAPGIASISLAIDKLHDKNLGKI